MRKLIQHQRKLWVLTHGMIENMLHLGQVVGLVIKEIACLTAICSSSHSDSGQVVQTHVLLSVQIDTDQSAVVPCSWEVWNHTSHASHSY